MSSSSNTKLTTSSEMKVPLEDPKRFRIEMTFSRGADLSPLEVICDRNNDCVYPFIDIS